MEEGVRGEDEKKREEEADGEKVEIGQAKQSGRVNDDGEWGQRGKRESIRR
jgi:hypothetical protein